MVSRFLIKIDRAHARSSGGNRYERELMLADDHNRSALKGAIVPTAGLMLLSLLAHL